MLRLYSKDNISRLILSMRSRDRLCHSFLLVGDKGVGKKTAAKYMALEILCRSEGEVPCGKCKDCRMISNDAHPDVMTVSASGKSGNYRTDDLRPLISDAYIASNEGGYKIYILPDIDKALPAAQNTLLKLFEEPPDHVIIIMTAERLENVLPTVRSRAIVINVPEASREDTVAALTERKIPEPDAEKAYGLLGGNIGACIEYLNGGSDELYLRVKSAAEAIAKSDEYALLKILNETDRMAAVELTIELSKVLSEAIKRKQGADEASFYSNEAQKLSETIGQKALMTMYDRTLEAAGKLKGNAGVGLTMADLTGKLIGRL
ncbi:MAG: AAA family ATPase [Oscillospiraceae bacterium]|nr:AAA family ATPase [Oscillospiraceae bacterium]